MDVEIIGYVASGLVLVSLLMTSLLRLRVINAIGAAVFTWYGLAIDAPPVWLVNGAIVLIDLWQLWVMLVRDRNDERVEAVRVPVDSPVLDRVLRVHDQDIDRFTPGTAAAAAAAATHAWLVLRDTTPASVLLAHAEDDRVVVDLDYATPATRDLRAGRLLHEDLDVLREVADGPVVTHGGPREHQRYLRAVGFRPGSDDPSATWVRDGG